MELSFAQIIALLVFGGGFLCCVSYMVGYQRAELKQFKMPKTKLEK